MKRHLICSVDSLPPGSRRVVKIGVRSIGVFNVDGRFYALRNSCPHQGGPICLGHLTGFATSPTPGEFEYLRKGEILRCPWHGWEFDVKTGQSWFDPARLRVATYPARVESGATLAADHCGSESDPGMSGLCREPYTLETYPVAVEADYVVVEVPGSS
ncbi:MAG: Rieske (2Fe-2S) protein [Acidobacteriota bacterium]|nr:Rieske (2Fe-2S) protein [Acidobacteriota bacterium]